MIVIDIGNTDTVIGIYLKKNIKKIFRLNTNQLTSKKNISTFFLLNKIFKIDKNNKICVISSVVINREKIISSFIKSKNYEILNINLKNIPKNIKFKYNSNQLGADRIANSYAAINKYGKNSLVVDFGTATTFDVVKNNIYQGGVIAPGINISLKALVNHASKLNNISIREVKNIVGKNTKHSMQSGFYWGYVSLVNGIINKLVFENKFKPKIILTGGLANIFKKQINYKSFYEPNLTLEGLYLIGLKKYVR
mgnify:CR=1 FL=1